MRRLPRLQSSIDLLLESTRHPPAASTICRTCRLRAASQARGAAFSTSAPQRARSITNRIKDRLFKKDDFDERNGIGVSPTSSTEFEDVPKRYANKYEPANTWEGLEWVGGKRSTQKKGKRAEPFQRFIPKVKATKPEDIAAAVRRALIEVLALREAGIQFERLRLPTFSIDDLAEDVRYEISANGQHIRPKYPNDEVKKEIFEGVLLSAPSTKEAAETEPSNAVASLEFETASKVVHEPTSQPSKTLSWKDVPLDPTNKFAIIKRVMQLTGIRVPDPKIQRCDTAGRLFHELLQKPKPAKLAQETEAVSQLQRLHNVKFSTRRVGLIEKEKQVGRWKIIEQELGNRGLPVMG